MKGLVLLLLLVQESAGPKPFVSVVPPPPQLTSEGLYAQLGKAHAQIELQQQYIDTLRAQVVALQEKCVKVEEVSPK